MTLNDHYLSRIVDSAKAFRECADRANTVIQNADRVLRENKVCFCYADKHQFYSTCSLFYERCFGEFQLGVDPGNGKDAFPLCQASTEIRIRAAAYLPEFLRGMATDFESFLQSQGEQVQAEKSQP